MTMPSERLGGPVRDKLRLYWSHCGAYRANHPQLFPEKSRLRSLDGVFNLGQEVIDRGYTAFKTNILIPGEPSRVINNPEQNVDIAMLKSVDNLISTFRKSVGGNVNILQT